MKSLLLLAVLAAALTGPVVSAQTSPVLKDQQDKISYSIGVSIGNNFKQQSIQVNPDLVAAGLRDALSGGKTQLTEEEVEKTLMAFQRDMMEKQRARAAEVADKYKKEGAAYLAENKKKEGVKTLPSGLQYKVITKGTGKIPKADDTVKTNYRGTLIDGTEFDSSYKQSEPVVFPVNGVIKGWTEALQLMPVGSKWQLVIPSELAYGERGAGREIGPNATLVFEIELLSIEPPQK